MRRVALGLLILGVVVPVTAQSTYVETGASGGGIEAAVSLDDFAYAETRVDLGYSIGGVLDVGLTGYGAKPESNLTETGFGGTLRVHMLKQSRVTPFSVVLGSVFGFSNTTGPPLTDNRLQRESTGFAFDLSAIRDLYVSNAFFFRLALKGSYGSDVVTTSLVYTVPSGEDTEYPQEVRETRIRYGGMVGFGIHAGDSFSIALGCDVLTNMDFEIFLVPRMAVVLSRSTE